MAHKHSRVTSEGRLVWFVERLWYLARELPVRQIPIDQIAEFDQDCWFGPDSPSTCRAVAQHARRIMEADLNYPILLSAEGHLIDGGHRIAKAYLLRMREVPAVQFPVDPEPDYILDPEAPLPTEPRLPVPALDNDVGMKSAAQLQTVPENVVIRRALPDDIEQFRRLRLDALQQHPEFFAINYEAERDKPASAWRQQLQNSLIYVAAVDETLVGMAGISRGSTSKTRHKGDIWGVYVRSEQRGHGIGHALVAACVAWAREQGMLFVNLVVATTNEPAIHCYKRCGFVIYGVEPNCILYNGVLYDEFVMTKPL